jgi:hypothetical protein
VTETKEQLLGKLGFRLGTSGPHAARTMMFTELSALFDHVPELAARAAYGEAIVTDNALGKPTKSARELSLRHLTALYGLDPRYPLFRALRRLWTIDSAARPVLALATALSRDPILRITQTLVTSRSAGNAVLREELERLIAGDHEGRFSPASLKSFTRNVTGTWAAAGFLCVRTRRRMTPVITPTNVAFCLFLGYLEGLSGQRLFTSSWMTLLGSGTLELEGLAQSASHRGLIDFMNAGGVKEIRFPNYLTQEEELARQEISLVV